MDDCKRISDNLCLCAPKTSDLERSKVVYQYKDAYYKTPYENLVYAMLLKVAPDGAVVEWSGDDGGNLPTGWLLCDGGIFDPTTYPTLYKILGTTSLPDCRARTITTKDDTSTKYKEVGEVGGEYVNGYILSSIPPHDHWYVDEYTGRGNKVDDDGGNKPEYRKGRVKVSSFTSTVGNSEPFVIMEPTTYINKIIKATPLRDENRYTIPIIPDPTNPRPPFVVVPPPSFPPPITDPLTGVQFDNKQCHTTPHPPTLLIYPDLFLDNPNANTHIDTSITGGGIEMKLVEHNDENGNLDEQFYISVDPISDVVNNTPTSLHSLLPLPIPYLNPNPALTASYPLNTPYVPNYENEYSIFVVNATGTGLIAITSSNRIDARYEAHWYLANVNPSTSEWTEMSDEDLADEFPNGVPADLEHMLEENTTFDESKLQWEFGLKYSCNNPIDSGNGWDSSVRRKQGRVIIATTIPAPVDTFGCPPQNTSDWKLSAAYTSTDLWRSSDTANDAVSLSLTGNAFEMDNYTP